MYLARLLLIFKDICFMQWKVKPSRAFRSDQIGGHAFVLPLASIESSFLVLAADGPSSYNDQV